MHRVIQATLKNRGSFTDTDELERLCDAEAALGWELVAATPVTARAAFTIWQTSRIILFFRRKGG